jgi:hypothetical protein
MKRVFILFIISLVACEATAQIAPVVKKFKNDTIIWSADTLLTYEDFTGRQKKKAMGATTTTIFVYFKETDGELRIHVEAIFVKSKSFIDKSSGYVLKHEQLHFDICELFARKLRQKISQKDFKKVKNVSEVVNNFYRSIFREFEAMQNKYDNETQHGLNAARQKVWEENIAQQLRELEAFSATEVNTVK